MPLPAEVLQTLPEDIRGEASLTSINDIPSLAKGFVSAQKMLGSRIEAPQKNWSEQQWGEFYDRLGRPKTPADYKLADTVKFPEGTNFDEKTRTEVFGLFHKLGLTESQMNGVMDLYAKRLAGAAEASQKSREDSRLKSEAEIRQKYGDQTDSVLDIARAAIKKVGSEDFVKFLEESGLGNNPAMVEVFHKIGKEMLEDNAHGSGLNHLVRDATAAKTEIDRLTQDAEYMKALDDRENPGHQTALRRWEELHRVAYPGKVA